MKWIKKGHIFETKQQVDWMYSHAQCPTALVLHDRIRIYFATRLNNQKSLPTFIDVEKDKPEKIIQINKTPILQMGKIGTFDEDGIIPSFLLPVQNKIYLYYGGWSQCKNVPYKNSTGLAISEDNGLTFEKFSQGPCLTLNEFDPFSATAPCIIEKDNQFIAIYSTGIDWIEIDGKLEHTYLLSYASSYDAIHWQPSGKILIEPENEFEAHCKPTVIKLNDTYHMWYSKRGSHHFRQAGNTAYRIGYAYSKDLTNWTRDDLRAGIDVSDEGWDSDMICYSYIVNVDGKYIKFYNGNGFGKSGFGYAVLEK